MSFDDVTALIDDAQEDEGGGGEYPDAWEPEEGDVLAGELVRTDARDGGYGPYPVLTVEVKGSGSTEFGGDDIEDGERRTFHGYHTVIKQKLAEAEPATGDLVAIVFHGDRKTQDGSRTYKSYGLKVKAQELDEPWS